MSPKTSALRSRLSELRAERDRGRVRGEEIFNRHTQSPAELAEIQKLTERGTSIGDEIRRLEDDLADEIENETRLSRFNQAERDTYGGNRPSAHVGHEARTYRPVEHFTATDQYVSFFGDAHRAQHGDMGAMQRQQRHFQEELTEGALSTRATTTGSYAGLVVPQYLVDRYALVLRNGRPTANIMQREPLPEQGMQFLVPRGTTGASAAAQATENTAVSSTDEVWANVTVNIATIAGQQDVSRQSLERGTPGIDSIIYMDLAKAYAAELDNEVINGSGASGTMLGFRQTAGITQVSAFAAAVTVATFISKTAGAVSSMASAGTTLIPNYWVMNPRRWYWLCSQVDTTNRPIAEPGMNGPWNAGAVVTYPGGYSGDGDTSGARVVGFLHGLPVITDANVPTSLGSGPEDVVYLVDSTQHVLWEEGDGMPRQLRFEQTLGGQLTVKLVTYGYVAYTAARFPGATAAVGGNSAAGFGLVAPTF